MNARIQRVLDGELPRSELSPAERATLERAEADLALAVRGVPEGPLPDLSRAVLQRIAPGVGQQDPDPAGASPARRAMHWLVTPRTLTLRPAWALAAAAAVTLVLLVRPAPDSPASSPLAAEPTPSLVLVHFQFEAPAASEVRLAGDFTDWEPTHLLSRSESGTWSVVVPLSPGVHEYAFVVDGEEWRPDPLAPSVADGFGGLNSRVAVLTPDAGTS